MNTEVGEPVRGYGDAAHPYIPPPYGFYATKDGYIALSSGRQVGAISRLLGLGDLAADPRFEGYWQRDENRVEFEEILEEALQAKTTAEWLELMHAEDLYVAPVKSLAEVFRDPQVLHNQMVVTVDSPIGPLKLVGPAFKLSQDSGDGADCAPPARTAHRPGAGVGGLLTRRDRPPPPTGGHLAMTAHRTIPDGPTRSVDRDPRR